MEKTISFESRNPTSGMKEAKNKNRISCTDADQGEPHAIEPELIDLAQVLSNKLHYIEHNISKITSKFDQLTNDISCHHEILRYDVSTSFDHLDRIITSIQENVDDLKSNFRDPTKERARNRKSVLLKGTCKKTDFERIPKSEEDKAFLSDAFKASAYHNPRDPCSVEEVSDLIDAMDSENFMENSIIVEQGSKVRNLYIVKTGLVDVHKDNELYSTIESKQTLLHYYSVDVVNNYEFLARTDCELWFIPAALFLHINTYHKNKRYSPDETASFFRNVSFSHVFCRLETNHFYYNIR